LSFSSFRLTMNIYLYGTLTLETVEVFMMTYGWYDPLSSLAKWTPPLKFNLEGMRAKKWTPSFVTDKHIFAHVDDGSLPPNNGLRVCLGSKALELISEGEVLILLNHISCGDGFPLSKFTTECARALPYASLPLSLNSLMFLDMHSLRSSK
jgi:hypothetical protein